MTAGLYKTKKLMIDRGAIKVTKAGPFFEVYVQDIMVGKVMKLSEIHCPQSIAEHDDCSGFAIKLPHMLILLSTEEYVNVTYELVNDSEKRADKRDTAAQIKADPFVESL